MSFTLGPRTLAWTDVEGRSGEIRLEITLVGWRAIDIGEGDQMKVYDAMIAVTSDLFDRTMKTSAEDDIQAIFNLMRASDIYLQQICEERHIKLNTLKIGELIADFGAFR